MIKETVQAVGTTHIVTETGSKTLLGNRQFDVGDSVWTHGGYAFGTERNNPTPMIIPVNEVSSGLYIISVEYNAMVIRDASQPALPAVKTIPLEMDVNNPSQMCAAYNKDGTKLSILSIVDSTNTVTIKTIDNGVLTDTTVTLPCEAVDIWLSNHAIIASYEADDLVWSIYCAKHDTPSNQPQNLYDRYYVPTVSAIYEYKNTELINTIDFVDKFENDLLGILRDIVSAEGFATISETNETTVVRENFSLQITSSPTNADYIRITINGNPYQLIVTAGWSPVRVAQEIADATYGDGWSCNQYSSSDDFVKFSRVVVEGVTSTISFSGLNTNTTGTFINQDVYSFTAEISDTMATPTLGISGMAELISIRNKEITLLQDGPSWATFNYNIIYKTNGIDVGSGQTTAAEFYNAKFKAKYNDSQRTLLEQHLNVNANAAWNDFTKSVNTTGGVRNISTTITCDLVPSVDTSHNIDTTTDIGPLTVVINGFTLQSENGVCKLVNGEQEIDITSACGDYPPTVNSIRCIIPLGDGVIIAGSWTLFYIDFATGTMESINDIQGFSLNTAMPLVQGYADTIVTALTVNNN